MAMTVASFPGVGESNDHLHAHARNFLTFWEIGIATGVSVQHMQTSTECELLVLSSPDIVHAMLYHLGSFL